MWKKRFQKVRLTALAVCKKNCIECQREEEEETDKNLRTLEKILHYFLLVTFCGILLDLITKWIVFAKFKDSGRFVNYKRIFGIYLQ